MAVSKRALVVVMGLVALHVIDPLATALSQKNPRSITFSCKKTDLVTVHMLHNWRLKEYHGFLDVQDVGKEWGTVMMHLLVPELVLYC
jgi:hypothetical protein